MKIGEKIKVFGEWRALAVWLVLAGLILCFFDYIFYIMDREVRQQEEKSAAEMIGLDGKDNNALGKDEEENLLDDSLIKIVPNDSLTEFEIWNKDAKVGVIKRPAAAQVSVLKRAGNDIYLGAGADGLGGYVLFGGPDEIYKFNLRSSGLERIFSHDGQVSNISNDGKKLAAIEHFYIEGKLKTYVIIRNMENGRENSFEVPGPYAMAGNVMFSSDGKKVAYEAAIGDPENEKFATFLVDLESGLQKKIAEGFYGSKYIIEEVIAAYDAELGDYGKLSPQIERERDRGFSVGFDNFDVVLAFERKGFSNDLAEEKFYVLDGYPAVVAEKVKKTGWEKYCDSKEEDVLACIYADNGGILEDRLRCIDGPTGGGMSCHYARFLIKATGLEEYPYLIASVRSYDMPYEKCGYETYDKLYELKKCYRDNYAFRNRKGSDLTEPMKNFSVLGRAV